MENKNIIFMGTPKIAAGILTQIMNDQYQVIAVVTQPDKKVGRKQDVVYGEVKKIALEHHIPIFQPVKIGDIYEELKTMPIDLIVTCAYGQFVPTKILALPRQGSINLHASLLPKWRGGAPIHHAIMAGDTVTGMSIMKMVQKMDAGDVMIQQEIAIAPDDTTGSLFDKLEIVGKDLISKSLPLIFTGEAIFNKQDENQATFGYNISKEEEKIDFQLSLSQIYNHIRGLIPAPVGFAYIEGKKIKFHKVRKKEADHHYQAGEIIGLLDGGYAIAVHGGYILVDEIQLEGKIKMNAQSFYNGSGKQFCKKIIE